MTEFKCLKCGSTNSFHYDGCLGYEAIVCAECGCYFDQEGFHEADGWSFNFAHNVKNILAKEVK